MSLDKAKDKFFGCGYTNVEDAVEIVYKQGRTDAIEEFQMELSSMRQRANDFHDSEYAVGYISAISTLEGFLAIEKEQK